MFFKKQEKRTTIEVNLSSQQMNTIKKIDALKCKRQLYIDDLENINNNKLYSTFINKIMFTITFFSALFLLYKSSTIVIAENQSNAPDSIIISLIAICLSLIVFIFNIVNMTDNRKYDDIQKIYDIQYELSLYTTYNIQNDIISTTKGSKNIQNLLTKYQQELYIPSYKKDNPTETKRNNLFKVIVLTILIAVIYDIVFYQVVTESISQSNSSILLTILTLAVSENKLLQKFIVLNDEKYQSNIIKLIKQFTVIGITSLVTLGSLSALLDKFISNLYQGKDTLIIMIVAASIQVLILIFINTQVKKENSPFIDFISE